MNSIKKIIGLLFVCFFLSSNNVNAQDQMLGEVRIFAGNFAPRGWAFCDGQLLPISQYSALFSLLGTMYGGDGRTTFALPDLRGRVAISAGNGPGLSEYRQGVRGGSEYTNITIAQLPSHTHAVIPNPAGGSNLLLSTDAAVRSTPQAGDVPAAAQFGNGLGATDVRTYGPAANTVNGQALGGSFTNGNTGGGQQVDKRQPYLPIRYIIALQGYFPSRS